MPEIKKENKVIERKLREDVAKIYKVKTIKPSKHDFKGFGVIDLRTISLEKANALFTKGFKYLELTDEGKKAVENAKHTATAKVETAKKDLLEMDFSDIKNFDRNKGLSIIAHLKIATVDKKNDTIFPALKKAQADLQPK